MATKGKSSSKASPEKVSSRLLKKASTKKEPQTMEELLAQADQPVRGWQVADVVEGIVTEKTAGAIYIDIGGKTEGMVIDREMKAARDFIKALEVGDQVAAIVTQPENDRGQTLLSLKKAAFESAWKQFEEKFKTQEIISLKGKEVNKGGLVVEVQGFQGFVPSSCFSAALMDNIDSLVGQELKVKLIEVDRKANRLIFSERAVSEASLLEAYQKALIKVKKGQEFEGKVSGVMPFGLFVKVKPTPESKTSLEGLVHISEISWEKVEDPSKFYKKGDQVKVKILAIDEKSGKLNLSIKQLLPDPWEAVKKKYKPETKAKGEVVRLAPFGIFVRLEPGIEGLVHISKVPAEQSIKVGDEVNCYVESVNQDSRRMSLGLVLTEKPVGYK